jgi:phosphohistidine phosphatase
VPRGQLCDAQHPDHLARGGEGSGREVTLKTLLVLRHAKSSWDDPALDDHERPLNARGEEDAPRIGRLARDERLAPELILSSDAVRARVTAEAMADATGGQMLLDPRLYHASAAAILAVLRSSVAPGAGTVMIVGHNPGLEELIAKLTGEREDFPTAALARIELPIERWADVKSATRGTLIGLWRPKELD